MLEFVSAHFLTVKLEESQMFFSYNTEFNKNVQLLNEALFM